MLSSFKCLGRASTYMTHSIHLTELESRICNLLVETAEAIKAQNSLGKPLVLRIAGGWVRDKLLGKQSDDIDIAIDAMKGEPFAHHLKEYMQSKGLAIGTVSTIQLNPDKSKHLETATVRVLGLDIDFVHLRTEVYDQDSRHPQVEFGSPAEDAMRRDITINALFYNLTTGQVEDFTTFGLSDLKNKLVRTPLPPRQTFLDDPLRILRVVRFATRFDYQIIPQVLEACKCEDIKDAFLRKISRERVGIEIDKMLKGPDPIRAMILLLDIGFYPLVFKAPPNVKDVSVAQWSLAITMGLMLKKLLASPSVLDHTRILSSPLTQEDIRMIHLAVCVVHYGNQQTTMKNKMKPQSVVKFVICDSIKLSNIDGETCHVLINNIQRISSFVLQHSEQKKDRLTTGLFIREISARPLLDKWSHAVLLAMVYEMCQPLKSFSDVEAVNFEDAEYKMILSRYQTFMEYVLAEQLMEAYDVKPLLNGNEIATLIGTKSGPQIGAIVNRVLHWQLENPQGTKGECSEFIKSLSEHQQKI